MEYSKIGAVAGDALTIDLIVLDEVMHTYGTEMWG